ncbi:MAG: DNA polymerase III subunit alpha [candidate division Zixibacteria bacterium]|nr:DNA polymerase III subunit alpha [candidate division Zixibacteria bacterium]
MVKPYPCQGCIKNAGMDMSFAHLHSQSNYSFKYGTIPLERLVELSFQNGFGAACLADREGLYGAVEFYRMCVDADIKPVIGVEMETELGRLLLYAKNYDGYGNLCRLVTEKRLYGSSITRETLNFMRDGVLAVIMESSSIGELKDIFNDDLYLKFENIPYEKNLLRLKVNIMLANRFGIKPVAANRVAFESYNDYPAHMILRAIDKNCLLSDLEGDDCAPASAYFRGKEDTKKLLLDFPGAIRNIGEVVEKCNLQLPIGELKFPRIDTGKKTAYEKLRDTCLRGLDRKYPKNYGTAISRLEFELETVRRMGFCEYFLVVHDITRYCRRNHIPVVGRGSAAGSLISYLLGYTEVDPIKNDLYFERFLNQARSDPPDVDLDLCWKSRDRVLEYVYKKYGANRVAMISSYITMQARMAVREICKVFGLPSDEISRFTKRLPYGPLSELKERSGRYPESLHLPLNDKPYRDIMDAAININGFPRHLSIHCGGIVISPTEITDLVPLEMSAKGIAITQYDMYGIDKLGLVKIDLLGQRALTVIKETSEMVRDKTGGFPKIPDYDELTYGKLRQGRSLGVFQIESPGMRAVLRDIEPKEENDITLALALIRPGASDSGMKQVFLDRHRMKIKPAYPHPSLKPVLGETLGTVIYQEQVLRIAEIAAGFDLNKADLLRRAMTKERGVDVMRKLRDSFVKGAMENGYDEKTSIDLFLSLAKFAGYGFCKAHAATYAHVSYKAMYLKTHFPLEYMCSVLNNRLGYYAPSVYLEETRRLGIEIRGLDVLKSEIDFMVEDNAIRVGLSQVKNLSTSVMKNIITERRYHRFENLYDFIRRVRPSKNDCVNLIQCGAFAFTSKSGPSLMWELEVVYEPAIKSRTDDLFASQPPSSVSRVPEMPDYPLEKKIEYEMEMLEMSPSAHPMECAPRPYDAVSSAEMADNMNKTVRMVGYLSDRKRIKTRDGKIMQFLTLEDEFDTFEAVLFPDTYMTFGDTAFTYKLLDISGKIEKNGGNLALTAGSVKPYIFPGGKLKKRKRA